MPGGSDKANRLVVRLFGVDTADNVVIKESVQHGFSLPALSRYQHAVIANL